MITYKGFENDKDFWLIFSQAINIVRDAYDDLKTRNPYYFWMKCLYTHFGEFIRPHYTDKVALEFNRLYYHKNLLKNMVSLWILKNNAVALPDHIIDIGCGAAPSTLACSLILNRCGKHMQLATFIDRSKSQINIAKSFFSELPQFEIIYQISDVDFRQKYVSTVIASYFFCEQNAATFNLFVENIDNLKNGIIIIDYAPIIEKIVRSIKRKCLVMSWQIELCVPEPFIDFIGEEYVQVSGCFVISKDNKQVF